MISVATTAQATNAKRLYTPMRPNITDGRPKIPAPMMALVAKVVPCTIKPTWFAAIFASVVSTISRACASPVRIHQRSRNSRRMEGGNFGAAPKPPWRGSYSAASDRAAFSSGAAPTSGPAVGACAARSRCASS